MTSSQHESAFRVSSPERAKRTAKALVAALKAAGLDGFSYSRCLGLVARMYGYADHETLVADRGGAPSADDAAAGPEIAAARRAAHVAVLVAAGVGEAVAASVVDAVKPTDRADPRKASLFRPLDAEVRRLCLREAGDTIAELRLAVRLAPHVAALPEGAHDALRQGSDLVETVLTEGGDVRSAVSAMLTFGEAGGTVGDLQDVVLDDLVAMIENGETDRCGRRIAPETAERIVAFVRGRAETRAEIDRRLAGREDARFGGIAPSALDEMRDAARAIGYREVMVRFVGEEDPTDYLRGICGMADRLTSRGVGVDALAACIADWRRLSGRPDADALPSASAATLSPAASPFPAPACDAAIAAALWRACGRGYPDVIGGGRDFRSMPLYGLSGMAIPGLAGMARMPDGRWASVVDLLMSAEAAGATVRDLAAAINHVVADHAREVMAEDEKNEKPYLARAYRDRAAWTEALDRCASPGRADAGLVAAVEAGQLTPSVYTDAGYDVDRYLEFIAALHAAADGGVRLSDLVAGAVAAGVVERASMRGKQTVRDAAWARATEASPTGPTL